jgi:predicted dinucleotide-binding enzyme
MMTARDFMGVPKFATDVRSGALRKGAQHAVRPAHRQRPAGDQRLTVFVAGGDVAAKNDVTELVTAIGFEAVDAGPLANARLLEPLGYLNIQLGYVLGLGTQIGLKLVRG